MGVDNRGGEAEIEITQRKTRTWLYGLLVNRYAVVIEKWCAGVAVDGQLVAVLGW